MTEIHFVKNNPFVKNDTGRHFRRNFIPTSASSTNIIANRSSSVQTTQRTQTVVQSASFSSLSNLAAQEESFLKVAISNGGTIPRNPSSQNHHITKSMSLEHSYSHGAIADLHLDENENETNFNGRVTHSRSYMDGLYVKTSEDDERRSNSPTLSCEFALLQMLCHLLLPKFGQKSMAYRV